jgi:hypothetical protein
MLELATPCPDGIPAAVAPPGPGIAFWFAEPAMVGIGMPPCGGCPLGAPAAGIGMPDCADGLGMVF